MVLIDMATPPQGLRAQAVRARKEYMHQLELEMISGGRKKEQKEQFNLGACLSSYATRYSSLG